MQVVKYIKNFPSLLFLVLALNGSGGCNTNIASAISAPQNFQAIAGDRKSYFPGMPLRMLEVILSIGILQVVSQILIIF